MAAHFLLMAVKIIQSESVGFCRGSRGEGRGSRVECQGSRESLSFCRGSMVEDPMSRVEGRGSRVIFITKRRFLF